MVSHSLPECFFTSGTNNRGTIAKDHCSVEALLSPYHMPQHILAATVKSVKSRVNIEFGSTKIANRFEQSKAAIRVFTAGKYNMNA